MTARFPIGSTIRLGGIPVQAHSSPVLAKLLYEAIGARRPINLFFANTNLVVKSASLENTLDATGTIVCNDGIGLDIATWLLYRQRFPENMNGTDFVPYLLQHAPNPLKVFLFGAEPGVADAAARHIESQLGAKVVGCCNGFDQSKDITKLKAMIANSGADVLLVALGNPAQENWILKHHPELPIPIAIGVGALFDFMAKRKVRAPKFIQQLHLEWLYRLLQEPRRLMRRYTWDILVFLIICLRKKEARHF